MFGIDFKRKSILSNVELSFLRNFFIIVYFISTVSGFIQAQNRADTLSSDGAWCWFSDPRAIYYKDEKEQIYFGYINSVGDVLIGVKDIETGAVHEFVLHDTLEVDDHNVTSILILPDGRLMVFYNEHNGNVYMRKSAFPESIDRWEDERIVCRESEEFRYCYSNPVMLKGENDRIYLIGRKVGPTSSFEHWWHYLKYSDDEGMTWSEEMILLDNEGRKNPPYLKVATDHQSRIDFLFTDGHPKIGPDVSTYHMYFEHDSFFQTNGKFICALENLPIPIKSVDKIYNAVPTQIRSWIWDIALKDGIPYVTYARYPTEHNHIYHYAYWQQDHWQDHEIVNSGSWMPSLRQGDMVREAHYSGGIVLDPLHPQHVYLSRDVSGKFEIEHCELQSGIYWKSELLTNNSGKNNVRPYMVYGAPTDRRFLMWMQGEYRHYTEFDTQLILVSLEEK
ncbi:MAG: BNR-4 repeat-containing protein [Saprospiraceae bacterium]|nr:BNR-4 repeat-containing protein [Saprospiraceae bacterium]